MFSKEERKALNAAFWTRFKEKAGVNKGANGKRINWVNYPTRVKQIYIRLHADTKIARFSIDIQDKDEGVRMLVWEQFEELRSEEHTSELQSRPHLVCRLLLEKKKNKKQLT